MLPWIVPDPSLDVIILQWVESPHLAELCVLQIARRLAKEPACGWYSDEDQCGMHVFQALLCMVESMDDLNGTLGALYEQIMTYLLAHMQRSTDPSLPAQIT